MEKFKVGQKLRLTNNIVMSSELEIGDVGVIMGIFDNGNSQCLSLYFDKLDDAYNLNDFGGNQVVFGSFIDTQFEIINELAEEEKVIAVVDNEILFAKMKDDVIIPSKLEENGGYDIYANFEQEYMIIKPHTTVMIPTKLCSAFSSKYVAILKERGSTGTKGMGQRAGVIDSGYRGEWLVPITNENDVMIVIAKKDLDIPMPADAIIYPYEKAICQAILVEVPKVKVKEITLEELKAIPSTRGEGKLGSSNK